MTYNLNDLANKEFGRLKIITAYRENGSRIYCDCICRCGKEKKHIRFDGIKSGLVVSCTCFQKEQIAKAATKHGMSKTKLYRVWVAIVQRCCNPKDKGYKWYGAKNKTVCKSWKRSFKCFHNYVVKNLGEKPSPKHSIDRIKNHIGYKPGNIRWATGSEQMNNTSVCRYYHIGGEKLSQIQVCRKFNILSGTLRKRLKRMPIKQAISTPIDIRYSRKR